MAQSIGELRAKLGVTSAPSAGMGLALDPNGRIPATLLPRYLPYTPTWTASGTAPAIGNAVVIAQYAQIGKLVHAYGSIVFGTSSTYGTGVYSFALPVTASANAAGGGNNSAGTGSGMHTAGFVQPSYLIRGAATTMGALYATVYLGANGQFGQLTPWTWTTGDVIAWNLLYEAA